MKTNTKTILSVMEVLAWIAFIGLCIKAGALLFTFLMTILWNPLAAGDLYLGLNLSSLFATSQWNYICVMSLIIFLVGQKAYFFFLVTRIFSKFNLNHPFSESLSKLLIQISSIALGVGILAFIAHGYVKSLAKKGVELPSLHDYLGGMEEYLFMAGIIFIIAQVFKRGLEIQSENELTV